MEVAVVDMEVVATTAVSEAVVVGMEEDTTTARLGKNARLTGLTMSNLQTLVCLSFVKLIPVCITSPHSNVNAFTSKHSPC
jgi:hypothetical protein